MNAGGLATGCSSDWRISAVSHPGIGLVESGATGWPAHATDIKNVRRTSCLRKVVTLSPERSSRHHGRRTRTDETQSFKPSLGQSCCVTSCRFGTSEVTSSESSW